MSRLANITNFLDAHLRTAEIKDYSGAHNGLQLENSGEVTHIASAVDASEAVIKKAIAAGANLLLVHHGLFWHGVQKITKAQYRKLKLAMDNDLAIYSSHLPLDIHPEHGNNALLCKALKMNNAVPFGDFKGNSVGLKQALSIGLPELLQEVEKAVKSPVHHCPGGKNEVGMVGVVTGGAGSEVETMKQHGIDTFITGEGPHWSYPLAEELEINLIYAGHYATETFGVKKLGEILQDNDPSLKHSFIHHPTGL